MTSKNDGLSVIHFDELLCYIHVQSHVQLKLPYRAYMDAKIQLTGEI